MLSKAALIVILSTVMPRAVLKSSLSIALSVVVVEVAKVSSSVVIRVETSTLPDCNVTAMSLTLTPVLLAKLDL